jgi:arginase
MQTHLIVVPYDSAVRGWRMGTGPERLLDAGLVDDLRAAGHQVRIEYIEADSNPPTEIRTAFDLNRALAGRVRDAREADALPVVLAGNCMTAVGTLAGLGGTPAVLWFDAHGDFNTPETTASGFLDGMALAMLTGRCWANLVRTVHGFQPVPERDVVLLGARELDAGERLLLDGSEIALLAPATGADATRARTREAEWAGSLRPSGPGRSRSGRWASQWTRGPRGLHCGRCLFRVGADRPYAAGSGGGAHRL